MKYELWTLAVVGAGTSEEPWAELHITAEKALASVVKAFECRLTHLSAIEKTDAANVRDALDDYAQFTIEPAIIDTDDLTEAE